MFGIGGGEWILVGLVALFVFGPEKLPTIARQAGAWLRDLRRMVAAARRDLDRELGMDSSSLRATDLTPRGLVRRHVLDGLDDGADEDEPSPAPRRSPGGSPAEALPPDRAPRRPTAFDADAT